MLQFAELLSFEAKKDVHMISTRCSTNLGPSKHISESYWSPRQRHIASHGTIQLYRAPRTNTQLHTYISTRPHKAPNGLMQPYTAQHSSTQSHTVAHSPTQPYKAAQSPIQPHTVEHNDTQGGNSNRRWWYCLPRHFGGARGPIALKDRGLILSWLEGLYHCLFIPVLCPTSLSCL